MEKLELKAKKVTTHNMRKMLPIYAKEKKLFAVTLIFMIVSGVVGVLQPIFSANALASLATGQFDKAIKYTLIMCSIGLSRIVFNLLEEFFYVKLVLKMRYTLTDMVIGAINITKMKKLDSTQLGALSDRLSTDVNSVCDVYIDMLELVFGILTNLVFMLYIAYLNFYIFLVLLGYVCILYVVCTIRSRIWIRGRKLTKKAKDIARSAYSMASRRSTITASSHLFPLKPSFICSIIFFGSSLRLLSEVITARSAYFEQINGIRDVKLLNIKKNVTDFSNKKHSEALKIEGSVNNKRNIARRIQTTLSATFELVFLLIGIAFVKSEMIMLAGLLVVYNYYGKVENLVSFMSTFKEYKADGEIAATRIFEVLEEYEKEEFGTEELEDFSGHIEFKNIVFGYNEEDTVLKGVDITFEPGKMTAIVGKSGSGKTTILSLISKLYDANDGKILLDGKDINTLTENAIHSNIGEISQAPYIFNASIKQNLLFVKPDATDEELVKVLKDAQIYKDIKKMPDGMDTEIGENGVKLSGGQKQRVAIARLLLMDSKVIIFDEATSALDNNSQNKIVEMLESYKDKKTIIIVAHRLSTIVNADKIYMLDGGKVIASGTHKQLMKNCKEYNELYKLEEQDAKEGVE